MMKMNFKKAMLVGALALASVGQANAAILGNSTVPGGSNLILSIWDATTFTSYTVDLGVTMASVLASPTTAFTVAADANLTTFLAGVAATDATLWNVVGMTGATSYLFTSATTPVAQSVTAVKTFNTVDPYMSAVNTAAGAASSVITVGGTTAAAAALNFQYAGSNAFGAKFTNKSTFDTTSGLNSNGVGLGSTMGLYGETALTRLGNGVVTTYANVFTLSSTGTLTYAAPVVVTAVPEPGEWALMLSGLALLGFIATRRKDESSMTFA